jgi:fermentation-respiration switch protein FrsA (DUF1100 family)
MTVALIVLVGLCAVLSLIWWSQERILFQPPRSYGQIVQTARIDYEASDGQHLAGYLIGEPGVTKGVLLCFHGNADLAMWQIGWAIRVAERTGLAVMLAEYRGYMSLGGRPTYAMVKLDALAAYDYLTTSLGVQPQQLAYFGHSLGSAVAAELAENYKPRALILQSPFTSASAMATRVLGAPMAQFWRVISRIHFDTARIVTGLDLPVSVAHGKRDRIVPFKMGMEVYSASRVKGPLLVVDDAGHNDIPEVAKERYWTWISAALTSQ